MLNNSLRIFKLFLPGQNFSTPVSSNIVQSETIHIFIPVLKEDSTARLLVTLKSLLYHQNRVKREREQCRVFIPNATLMSCSEDPPNVSVQPIHLHLLCSDQTREWIRSYFNQWNLSRLIWTTYLDEDHLVSEFYTVIVTRYYFAIIASVVCHLLPNASFFATTTFFLVRCTQQ